MLSRSIEFIQKKNYERIFANNNTPLLKHIQNTIFCYYSKSLVKGNKVFFFKWFSSQIQLAILVNLFGGGIYRMYAVYSV